MVAPEVALLILDANRAQRQEKAVAYIPSPEEIAAVCRQIQSEWSDYERERRHVVRNPSWSVPTTGADAE